MDLCAFYPINQDKPLKVLSSKVMWKDYPNGRRWIRRIRRRKTRGRKSFPMSNKPGTVNLLPIKLSALKLHLGPVHTK